MAPREWGWHNHSGPQGRQTREIEAFGRPRVFEGRRVAELLSRDPLTGLTAGPMMKWGTMEWIVAQVSSRTSLPPERSRHGNL